MSVATVRKRRPVKRTTLASVPTEVVEVAPVKKTATRKTTTAKKVTKKSAKKTASNGRAFDEHGYMVGTDSSAIAALLVEGGKDRGDIAKKIAKKIGTATRSGGEKNIAALVSAMTNKLIAKGYKVDSTFRLVPPARRGRKPKTPTA